MLGSNKHSKVENMPKINNSKSVDDLGVQNLIVFWDDNNITIDGSTSLSCGSDIGNIFLAHGWEMIEINGHNYDEIRAAIAKAKTLQKPVCIRCKTTIGIYSDDAGTEKAHSGKISDLQAFKRALDMDYVDFELSKSILDAWKSAKERSKIRCLGRKNKFVDCKNVADSGIDYIQKNHIDCKDEGKPDEQISAKDMANALRFLVGCMVSNAGSGHLGMPLGMADVAAVLWSEFLDFSPLYDLRDRFILSCGHGSALLYSLLYLFDCLTLDDLKQFRKLGSRTPGHPEYAPELGVELTTGPLGQGLACAIGMTFPDYWTYVFCSDGDLMEGIAHEAIAIAAKLWSRKFDGDSKTVNDPKLQVRLSRTLSTRKMVQHILDASWQQISKIDNMVISSSEDYLEYSVCQSNGKDLDSGNGQDIIKAGKQLAFIGTGSADLGESTCTKTPAKSSGYVSFGVREHGMVAFATGKALCGKWLPVATFLSFTDYAKPTIRLASMMQAKLLLITTHDSIGVGEDGPTHQPVEQLWSLRLIPGLQVFRPSNFTEMLAAFALAQQSPSVIVCSRQDVANYPSQFADCLKGGYVFYEDESPACTIVATGSEIELAMSVSKLVNGARVVSMPSLEVFRMQSEEYQREVLGQLPRFSIEAGASAPWYKYVDLAFGIDEFGKSGSCKDLFDLYLNSEQIAGKIKGFLDSKVK